MPWGHHRSNNRHRRTGPRSTVGCSLDHERRRTGRNNRGASGVDRTVNTDANTDMNTDTASATAPTAPETLTLYTTSWCPFCLKLMAALHEDGIAYTQLD